MTVAVGLTALGCGGSTTNGSGGNAAPSTTVPALNKVGAVQSGPPDGPSRTGGKVVYGIDAEPEGLDPTRYAFSQSGHAVASAVFDPLATIDENGNAVPYLATAFEHNSDFTEWTVVLPTGVTFHDNTPLDAAAVATDLNAYRTSAITAAPAKQFVSVEATDSTHVVLKLDKPNHSLPLLFTTQAGYIFAPAMLASPDLAKKPIGSGPFVFQNHVDGEIWTFSKNPNYRQKGLPKLDGIDFKPVVDAAERNAKLAKGDLDLIQTYTGQQITELRGGNFKRVENQHGDKSFLVLNTSAPPFDNLTARKAVAFATDAAQWRKNERADVAGPANSPYGPGQPGYLADNGYPTFNLDSAKKLAQQYQQETGKQLEFTFTAVSDATNAAAANSFASTFEAAGMKVTVQQMAQINLLAQVATGNYQMSQFRLFGSPNPDTDIHFYRGSSVVPGVSLNFPHFVSPEIDAAIDQALGTDDVAVKDQAYQKVSKILAEQVPYLWLGQETWVVSANPRVNGIYGAMNGSLPAVGPRTWTANLALAA